MPSQRLSRRENTSVWRSTISGVAMSVKAMCWVGATTVTVPVIRSTSPLVTWQSKTIWWLSGRFSLTVSVPAIRSPTVIEPEKRRSCATMTVPGPGRRRCSSADTSASAATASADMVSWRVLCASVWNGSTSPETKASASTSGRVRRCERVMASPSWISSKVRLLKVSVSMDGWRKRVQQAG